MNSIHLSIRIFIPLVALFVWLSSCESRKTDTASFSYDKGISFEKLDSVTIDFLGLFSVQDVDPVTKTVLFTDKLPYSAQIFLADFDGNIFQSFSKFGDMPDAYGLRLAPMRIQDGRKFLVYSSNGFITYDFDGNMLSKIKLTNFEMPGRTGGGMTFGMERQQNRYLMMNSEHPLNKDYTEKNIYKSLFLLDRLDPETGKKESLIQFPETSIFRSGKHFFRSAWDPAFTLADNHIYVAFGLEPVIYVYEDSAPYSLLYSIPLDLPEYRYFKGTDSFTEEGNTLLLRFTSAFVENIKKIDDYFLVAYFPGYDNADSEMRFTDKSPEEAIAFNDRMKQKYPYRIAVLDSTGRLINDFVPEGLEAYSMLVRNDELWMLEKPDEEVEQDYFRLFRVGLKTEITE